MKLKDYFLSQENFELIKTEDEGVLKTSPIPENISKYYESSEYLSHHKQKNILSRLYSSIQKINLNYKLKIIQQQTSKKKLLDYGCGDGTFLDFMQQKGYLVQGVEPNLDLSSKSYPVHSSISELTEKFDIITLWHVLEHIENREEIISELKDHLSDSGCLFIALPNHHSFDATYYNHFWAGYDVPRHIYHYSQQGAKNFFKRMNLELVTIKPLIYDSFFVSLLSEKYKNTYIGKIRWFFIGLISNLKADKSQNFSSLIYILRKLN